PDYTSIINPRQQARLNSYLDDAQAKGARIIPLFAEGQDRRLPHTLLLDVGDDMLVMQDEIFGPLLPIVPYRQIGDAIDHINARPRPLALYYFGYDREEQEQVICRTHSGGVGINETLLHVAVSDLPFGGIGPSGMGHYHGHEGFLTFSKTKAVLRKPRLNATRVLYPPYGKPLQKLLRRLLIR
ncbi:MAG: aldehyde dehydrogenase family protein, partial [Gammaproteobacteria bacterium]|nr:aldehyde dehydrogenase family protein [Gammaproteobacteria bacterium]